MALTISRFPLSSSLRTGRHTNSTGGRNSSGRITVRHRGGGHKRLFRTIDWERKSGSGIIVGFTYDPRRTARLAKIFHPATSSYSLTLASAGIKLFQKVNSHSDGPIKANQNSNSIRSAGDRIQLFSLEPGDLIHSISMEQTGLPLFSRAAGTSCQVRSVDADSKTSGSSAVIRLPSGSIRRFPLSAWATVGAVSSDDSTSLARGVGFSKGSSGNGLGKAGRARWLGRRPTVRGVARNPVDHPHGGNSRGRPSVTFRGWPTKGRRTRRSKRTNAFIISSRVNLLLRNHVPFILKANFSW